MLLLALACVSAGDAKPPSPATSRATSPAASVRLSTGALTPSRAATAPTTTSSTRPAPVPVRVGDPLRHPAIQAAVKALTKEIETSLRTRISMPRGASDYFKDNPASDLPPQIVAGALRRVGGADPRIIAYVRWQLLSGLAGELDAKTIADLMQAYRAAPVPRPRPGVGAEDREQLSSLLKGATQSDEPALQTQFAEITEALDRDNAPVLAYRDALFELLPPGFDSTAAGFEDVLQRMEGGHDPLPLTRTICDSVNDWSATASPAELKRMLAALQPLVREKGNAFYDRIAWDGRSKRVVWKTDTPALSDSKPLKELLSALEDRIASASAPLKLREKR